MSWYGERVEKIRKLPKAQFILFVVTKVIGAVGIGLLLATWLPVWTWWIFMVIALIIGIPLYQKIFSK